MSLREDTRIQQYYSLRPAEFHDVERLEICQSGWQGNDYEMTVELDVRHVKDQHRRLRLSFSGVTNFRLTPPEGMALQLSLLEIRSMRDRQWEGINYSVEETEHGTISFLCYNLTASVHDYA